jgi:hypothetical protein
MLLSSPTQQATHQGEKNHGEEQGDQEIPEDGGHRPVGDRVVGFRRVHRDGDAVHAGMDPVHGRTAVQDAPPELRHLSARRIQRRRKPDGPVVRRRPHRRHPAVPEDPGGDRLRRDLRGGDADNHPLYFHAKLGTPEDALFKLSPALAVGGYNFGTKSGDARAGELTTKQDIVYALAAKTIPVIGRLSAGYYVGNRKALLDANGASDEKGLLLSWDRVMTEISDKLWLAVDYQGGDSALGALSIGASWAFAKNVSVLLGYDIYNEERTGGQNTVTLQIDINFP